MDVREKLVELIGSTEYGNGSLVGNNFQKGFIEKIASQLIAHGVTVHDWIPVTERMPEEHDSIFNLYHGTPRWTKEMFRTLSDIVLVVIIFEDGSKAVKFANTEDGKWNIRKYYRAQEVTHWMPLPQPPKGE